MKTTILLATLLALPLCGCAQETTTNQTDTAAMNSCGNCDNGSTLYIPAGVHTLYLYDNEDGTIELSREPIAGKKLMGGDSQSLDNLPVNVRARKAIVEGRLVIIRGNRMFDVTGKEL